MAIVRVFAPSDAAAVSDLIRTTMRESNTRDYLLARLEPLIDYFTPAKVLQLSQERFCIVAEANHQIIGTAALEGAELCTFFVHPAHQRAGIGTRLLAAIERHARMQGLIRLVVDASLTGAAFYHNHGYTRTGVEYEGTAGTQIGMAKDLA